MAMAMATRDRSRRWSAAARALVPGMALVGALAGCNDIFDSNSYSVNGRLYQSGMTFIPADDCNTCTCGSDGRVACTLIACELPQPIRCAFDSTYNYGLEGG